MLVAGRTRTLPSPEPMIPRYSSLSPGVPSACGRERGGVLGGRQCDDEAGARVKGILDPHGPAVQRYDLPGDVEAEAQPGQVALRRALLEAGEDRFALLWWHADPVVGHRQADFAVFGGP